MGTRHVLPVQKGERKRQGRKEKNTESERQEEKAVNEAQGVDSKLLSPFKKIKMSPSQASLSLDAFNSLSYVCEGRFAKGLKRGKRI